MAEKRGQYEYRDDGTTAQLVTNTGNRVAEQLTQDNAPISFAKNVDTLEIYNVDATNTGVFTVNGIGITVPSGKSFKAAFGGVPSKSVTVTGSTSYILTRYE